MKEIRYLVILVSKLAIPDPSLLRAGKQKYSYYCITQLLQPDSASSGHIRFLHDFMIMVKGHLLWSPAIQRRKPSTSQKQA